MRERKGAAHVGKWTAFANGTDAAGRPPSIVICTYGAAAAEMLVKGKNGPRSRLIAWHSVSMLVVDETSGVLCRLPEVKNWVFVGDEHQLPPFGYDRVPGLVSLFDAAKAHSDVPTVTLADTYRLPPAVGKLISQHVYRGELQMQRTPEKDQAFRADASRMTTWLRAKVTPRHGSDIRRAAVTGACLLGDLIRGPQHGSADSSASLAWLHHSSVATRDPETSSTGNRDEASVVGALAACLIVAAGAVATPMDVGSEDDSGAPRVIVITPYLHQKVLLELAIARGLEALLGISKGKALHRVTSSGIVNTADSFQGQVRREGHVWVTNARVG